MKEVIEIVCQPKVMIMTGAIAMVVGGAINNDNLCSSGFFIVCLAFIWGFAKAIKEAS